MTQTGGLPRLSGGICIEHIAPGMWASSFHLLLYGCEALTICPWCCKLIISLAVIDVITRSIPSK